MQVEHIGAALPGELALSIRGVSFAFREAMPVLENVGREPVLRTTGVEARNYMQDSRRAIVHLTGSCFSHRVCVNPTARATFQA